MSVEPSQGLGHGARLAGYFATESMRTGESEVSTWLQVRDDLRDAHGGVRIGPIVYSIDVATGLAMGVTVLADDRWVVTTDVDVRLITPVIAGPVRVDAEVLRAGATTAVSSFTLHDESTGQVVGGGTCTGRPFPFEFDRRQLDVPLGVRRLHAPTEIFEAESLPQYLGLRIAEGGGVEVEIGDWLRNPWGILHGGVTSCLVDVSAEAAGAAALGRPVRVADTTVRFLAPGRVGPARAVPRVLTRGDGTALIEVKVTDAGANDRLLAVAAAVVI
ncbi:MAG TPA: hotdog domain-containing protein [Frankiaceae bacterium]|nr:hotdog domain-containing protein [Frankiaceae bacterium]